MLNNSLWNQILHYYENTTYLPDKKITPNKQYTIHDFSMLIKEYGLYKMALILFAEFSHSTQEDIDVATARVCIKSIEELRFKDKVFTLLTVNDGTFKGCVLLSFRKDDELDNLIWLTMYHPKAMGDCPFKISLKRFKDNQMHAEIELTIHTGVERYNANCGVCIFEALRHYIQDPTTMPPNWTPIEIEQFRKAHIRMTKQVEGNPYQVSKIGEWDPSSKKRQNETLDNNKKKKMKKFDVDTQVDCQYLILHYNGEQGLLASSTRVLYKEGVKLMSLLYFTQDSITTSNHVAVREWLPANIETKYVLKDEVRESGLTVNEIIKLSFPSEKHSSSKPSGTLQFNLLVNGEPKCVRLKMVREIAHNQNGTANSKGSIVLLSTGRQSIRGNNYTTTTNTAIFKSFVNDNSGDITPINTKLESSESSGLIVAPPSMFVDESLENSLDFEELEERFNSCVNSDRHMDNVD